MPTASSMQRPKKEPNARPQSGTTSNSTLLRPPPQTSERTRPVSSSSQRSLRKSLSYQNLKTPTVVKTTAPPNTDKSLKRPTPLRLKHGSAANIPDACSKTSESDSQFQSHLSQKSRTNSNRISVNSDLLSRVEKEKKQYEARISELTQITESRKMEIEKLTFELRHSKEDKDAAYLQVEKLKQENLELNSHISSPEGCLTEEGRNETQDEACVSTSAFKKPFPVSQSPPESVGTTTRLTPGGATTGVTASSFSSDWNEATISLDAYSVPDLAINYSGDIQLQTETIQPVNNSSMFLATLQGRLLQMEEANYSTNEELQATLQELWDLQRTIDQAQEETNNLASEREILLEALSTQTTKLEHCRFQIEQLKLLLLTDRRAQTPGSMENHFCGLYASIEEEKQMLLDQNDDLAQRSDSLTQECCLLSDNASQLQDDFDRLQEEHATLTTLYHELLSKCQTLKPNNEDEKEGTNSSNSESINLRQADHPPISNTMEVETGCPLCSADPCSQTKVDELKKDLAETREKLELLQSERERETTEWRLYERDLLKTVQVAEGIRSETETEAMRISKENEGLLNQVEKLSRELKVLSAELRSIKDTTSTISLNDTANKQQCEKVTSGLNGLAERMTGLGDENVRLNVKRPHKDANQSPVQPKCTSPEFSSATPERLPSTTVAPVPESPFSARSHSLVGPPYAHHRPVGNFGHATRLHSYTAGSPGAPTRPSCVRNGPTVRSLIQTIENQVKAVQQQKRCLASNGTNVATSPLRLYSRTAPANHHAASMVTRSTVAASNLVSPVGQSKLQLRSVDMHSGTPTNTLGPMGSNGTTTGASSTVVLPVFQESASAPGGPPPPPSLPPTAPSLQLSSSDALSDEPSRKLRSTMVSSGKPDSTDGGKEQHGLLGSPDSSSLRDSHFSPTRPNTSVHDDNLGTPTMSIGTTNLTIVDQPTSPTNLLQNGTSNRRHPSSENTTKLHCQGVDSISVNHTTGSNGAQDSLSPPDTLDASTAAGSVFPPPHQLSFYQDPLQELARQTKAGSKRNALLRWCQSRVSGYRGVEVTNFSSSWNNGLALCALLHTYMPKQIPWGELVTPSGHPVDKRLCFELAFKIAETAGIPTTLRLQDMLNADRPDWNAVMSYVTAIYRRYEVPPSISTGSPSSSEAASTVTTTNIMSSVSSTTPGLTTLG